MVSNKPLSEYYENLDRENLPPEFTEPDSSFTVHLANTTRGYRTKDGEFGVLHPHEFPIQRVITVFNQNGDPVSRWTEDLPTDLEFDSNHVWVQLGPGIMPKRGHGVKRAIFDLALGYLSGYPLPDVFRYLWNISLSGRRALKILDAEINRPAYESKLIRYEEKIRIANPHYDERDT